MNGKGHHIKYYTAPPRLQIRLGAFRIPTRVHSGALGAVQRR